MNAWSVRAPRKGSSPSIIFENAADSSLDVEERSPAAYRLDKADRARLRSQLLARLPGQWDLAAANDIRILGIIGDADTARRLEALEHVPHESPGDFRRVIAKAVKDIPHNREWEETPAGLVEIAADPKVDSFKRLWAVSRLDAGGEGRVRSRLLTTLWDEQRLAALPDEWRRGVSNLMAWNLIILGKIGDADTIKELEKLEHTSPKPNKEIRKSIDMAIKEIQYKERSKKPLRTSSGKDKQGSTK